MTQMRPIWVRREVYCCDWYDWDAWTRVCSDMTETPKKCFRFSILHTRDCDTLWINDKKIGRLSHICTSLGQCAGKRTSAHVMLLHGAEVNIRCRSPQVGAELTRARHRLSRKFGVSVISLQTVVQASQLYQFSHSSFHKVIVMTEKVKTVIACYFPLP